MLSAAEGAKRLRRSRSIPRMLPVPCRIKAFQPMLFGANIAVHCSTEGIFEDVKSRSATCHVEMPCCSMVRDTTSGFFDSAPMDFRG